MWPWTLGSLPRMHGNWSWWLLHHLTVVAFLHLLFKFMVHIWSPDIALSQLLHMAYSWVTLMEICHHLSTAWRWNNNSVIPKYRAIMNTKFISVTLVGCQFRFSSHCPSLQHNVPDLWQNWVMISPHLDLCCGIGDSCRASNNNTVSFG